MLGEGKKKPPRLKGGSPAHYQPVLPYRVSWPKDHFFSGCNLSGKLEAIPVLRHVFSFFFALSFKDPGNT